VDGVKALLLLVELFMGITLEVRLEGIKFVRVSLAKDSKWLSIMMEGGFME
jgi:hypothetical protein